MTTPAVLAAGLETAFNALLRLDPETQARLAALDGNVIAIEPEGLGLILYLWPNASGIQIKDCHEGEPTVYIRGTPLALARQWRGQRPTDGAITVEGNTAVASEFQAALAHLDIDGEEQLSKGIGDAAAHQTGQLLRGFQRWSQRTGDTLLHNSAEYLQQEAQVLPPRHAVEQFLSAVDTLREDADRMAARIERLRQQIASAAAPTSLHS